MDEPTIGLHVDDIKELLTMLQKLLDSGHTVVVVEHTVDVIKCAEEYRSRTGKRGSRQTDRRRRAT